MSDTTWERVIEHYRQATGTTGQPSREQQRLLEIVSFCTDLILRDASEDELQIALSLHDTLRYGTHRERAVQLKYLRVRSAVEACVGIITRDTNGRATRVDESEENAIRELRIDVLYDELCDIDPAFECLDRAFLVRRLKRARRGAQPRLAADLMLRSGVARVANFKWPSGVDRWAEETPDIKDAINRLAHTVKQAPRDAAERKYAVEDLTKRYHRPDYWEARRERGQRAGFYCKEEIPN